MEETVAQLTEEAIYQKTPQELTRLLYQACIEKLEKAIVYMKDKNYMLANQFLQKCNDLLYRLGAGLNYEAGIVSDQLEALYDYMSQTLIEANIKKDTQKLEEVLLLLSTIKEAWDQAWEKGIDKKNSLNIKKASLYERDFNYYNGSVDRKE